MNTRTKLDALLREHIWRSTIDVAETVDAVFDLLMEPGEGARRAFISARFEGDAGLLEPRTGSGQGDFEMVPAYENVWEDFAMDVRWRAMLTAIREGK